LKRSGKRTSWTAGRRESSLGTRPVRSRRDAAGTAVFLVLAVDSLVNGLFVPLSMLYLSASSGASLVRVGTLLSLAGPVSLPLPLWIGGLVDRLGPKPIVLVAQLLQAAGFLGYLMVRSSGAILLAATVAAMGQRAFWSSAFTLVSDLSDRDPGGHSRERWFGIIGSLRAVGYGVGAVVAGVALSAKSGPVYRGAIGACACLLLVAALLRVRGVPRSVVRPARAGHEGAGEAESGEAERGGRGYRVSWSDESAVRGHPERLRQAGAARPGIGSALVAAASEHAARLGSLCVTVHSGRKAVPVYERLGFESSRRLLSRPPD